MPSPIDKLHTRVSELEEKFRDNHNALVTKVSELEKEVTDLRDKVAQKTGSRTAVTKQ